MSIGKSLILIIFIIYKKGGKLGNKKRGSNTIRNPNDEPIILLPQIKNI